MKKTSNRTISIVFLFLLLSVFLAWFYNKQIPSRTVIGINSWTGYDPLLLASEINLFEKNNVQVTVQQFASTGDELQAIKEGKIDGAGLTLDEAFSLIGAGYPGKIVLIVDFSRGGDMIIGKTDIQSVSDLKGKRVGYEGTVVGEFLLQRALQAYHIKNKEIELINVPAENWLKSFKNNDVDALVCFNPVASILLSEEEGHLLFSSKDIPFEIIDVLLFSEEYYRENKAQIKKILHAWFEALNFLQNNLDSAATIIAGKKNITPEIYKTGMSGLFVPGLKENQRLFKINSEENMHKYSQNIIDFMLKKGLLNFRLSTLDIFEASIISELNKE